MALPLYLAALGESSTAAGLILTASAVVMALLVVAVGLLGDLLGRRSLLIALGLLGVAGVSPSHSWVQTPARTGCRSGAPASEKNPGRHQT